MSLDIYALGNALLDIEISISEDSFQQLNIEKGAMTLIDEDKLAKRLNSLKAQGISISRQAGGSAANTVYAAAQLGCNCSFSGRVGYDESADTFKISMLNASVNPLLNNPKEDSLTGTCLAYIHDDAQRTFETYLGASSSFSKEDLDSDALQSAGVVYCEGFLIANDSAFEALLTLHRRVKGSLALTLSDIFMVKTFKERFTSLLQKGTISYLFCNESEALAFSDTQDINKAIQTLAPLTTTLVITLAEKGCLIHQNKKSLYVKSKTIKALNTNGAGDAFAGAFLASMAQNYSLENAAKRANQAAAVVVQQAGPRFQGFL